MLLDLRLAAVLGSGCAASAATVLDFDSGGQRFSTGFFTPASLATVARIGYQSRFELHGLKSTFRTFDSRSDGLERTHWRKVWRAMVED
jgi:hypothetical protein